MRSKAKQRTKKIMRSKGSDTQIRRNEIETFFSKLQQVVKESRNDDQIPQDCTVLHTNNKKQSLPKRDSTFIHTNTRNEGHNDYTCRCKYLSEIPSNMFPPLYKRISSSIGRYEVELNFIQAIVWLKSVTACIPQISVKKLQQLFDKQCNMRDNYNYDENRHVKDVDVESSFPINKTPSIHEMLNNSTEFITSNLTNISDSSYNVISSMIYKSYIDPEDIQSRKFDFISSSKDRNRSVAEFSKPETNTYIITNQKKRKKFLSKPCIIPDLGEDSLSDMNDLFDKSDDMQEHQNFEIEQILSKNLNKRINNEITEDKTIYSTLKKPETSTSYIMTNQEKRKEFLSKSCIIPDLDEDSLSDMNDLFEKSDDMQEHQNFENEQISSKNSNKRINNEITEDKTIYSTLKKPETSTNYIMTNQEKRKEFLSKSCIIPDLDEDTLSDMNDLFEESDDMQEHQNFENEQISSKNSNKRINNEIIEDESICSISKNNADISKEYRSVSLTRCQSFESILNLKYNSDNEYITPMTSQYGINDHMKTPDYHSPTNFTNYLSNINFSQMISPISCMIPQEQKKANNFQTDQGQSKALHDYNDDDFEYDINDNSLCTSKSDTAAENQDHDSAYSTWKIETLNYDTAITTKPIIANKHKSDVNIGCHYNLRSHKKHIEVTVSPSLIQKPARRRASAGNRCSSKKRKLEPAKDLAKKKKENRDEVISASWLDFTIELLNSEHVILTSVKVILSMLCDKKTAQEYVAHRCWKDSLEEQAVNAVLNIADVLRMEKKPDICAKQIEKTIIETLDEMLTSLQLNETFIWIYRIQIILKFCNLLSICIKTINYLIIMLETLQYVLINAANENGRTTEIEINQLHLVSYALDMALRTYRILVPRDKKSQSAENAIPYVADLWKMRYRIENEKLEDTSFDLDATEKKWINVFQKFTVASVKHLVQFTDISFSLYHILIST
ncbi:putative leucine-rich repeat-containing protein DDB_G0290503 [Polyergus mexicanus]|uniref:putative leucine-rich repeat-containing protein DDB_G0290503 n=1 Tax=Polyergus mexicanus TaxID=615972 RepID=UPI0038B45319